ncbi:MAG: C4-dicarboxylate ABC transporter [Paracoccus denitrificans]|nr:MAG: C4-dicarboxylate ABC transporter [Paracoccus denitrificans]PZO84277.1 MAG: C4-dicarboxylate ABC transporter [Paracoccus denitrificans]
MTFAPKTTLAVALSALVGWSGAAAAETLRVADSLPTNHYISGNLIEPWMKRVTELTKGEVTFDYYPAEQMGKAKDLFALLQTGAIDIAYVGVSYTPDKLPLASVAELPEAFTSSCVGSKAYWEMAKPGATLDQAEFAPQKSRMLIEMVLAPYQLMTAKREITDVASLKGMKIRATGGAKEIEIQKLGSTAVGIAAPEAREALSRGTIDGILFPYSSVLPYDLGPELSYSTTGLNLGSFISSYMINADRWQRLSPEVQAAMDQASAEIMPQACAAIERIDAEDREKLAAQGVKMVTLPEAEIPKLDEILQSVGADWAQHLDARGKPGTAVLEEFRSILESQAAN